MRGFLLSQMALNPFIKEHMTWDLLQAAWTESDTECLH